MVARKATVRTAVRLVKSSLMLSTMLLLWLLAFWAVYSALSSSWRWRFQAMKATMKRVRNTTRDENTSTVACGASAPTKAWASDSTGAHSTPPGASSMPKKRMNMGPSPHDICEMQMLRPRLFTSDDSLM